MKVFFIAANMAGGGAERVTALLSGWFYMHGTDIGLITDTFIPFAYNTEIPQSNVYSIYKSVSQKHSKVSFLYKVNNVRKILKQEKPDVVVGIMPWMLLVAFIANIGLSCKLIASHHTSFSRPVNFHIEFIKRFIYPLASATTILTQADADYLGDRLANKVVMPNPLAFPVIREYNLENRRKNILAVGRLDVWHVKGFDILLDAWSMIATKYPEWILEIAGTGSEESNCHLVNMVKELKMENRVRFLGFCENIDAVMRESSIFVLSSRIEGFGMVLIEAMSQGCACVSFDDGGRQREIIRSDQEGIIVENHTPEELSSKIEKLLTDDDLRLKVAVAGVERSSDYELPLIARKWENLFASI